MVPASLLTTLFLAVVVVAETRVIVERSLVTLPISKRRVNRNKVHNLYQHDQIRAKALRTKGEAKAAGVFLHNDAVITSTAENQGVSYIASVGVGSPATTYNLIVDTGSSNTWVGAAQRYVQTRTSTKTSNTVSCKYGTGSFSGNEFIDQVTIAPGLVITNQSIGVASESRSFTVDGILGIGPTDLTIGTLSPGTRSSIPTVTDNLFSAGTISAHEIGISFEPLNSSSGDELNGEITWGGIDSSKFNGSITFTPITTTSPASGFWGIDQSIKYGATTILSTTAGIVDTGTTLILIATDAFEKYQSATGATFDSNAGLLRITSAQFANLKTLSFDIGGTTFDLIPNAQIWPRNLNSHLGGNANVVYMVVGDLGSPSGSGLDFINGQSFLERFYSVFDTANQRVGLAITSFTTATN